MSVWRRLSRGRSEPEFSGAPAVRRIKTYSAQSGYVYQYYFDGRREHQGCSEYRFQAAIDAKSFAPVLVRLSGEIIGVWQGSAARELIPTELYGVAKLLLFKLLDETDPAALHGSEIKLSHEELNRIAKELDL